jgi:hypothetical protein
VLAVRPRPPQHAHFEQSHESLPPFESVDLDFITYAKRLRPQQQQAGKEILQNVLEGEADCDASYAENFIRSLA